MAGVAGSAGEYSGAVLKDEEKVFSNDEVLLVRAVMASRHAQRCLAAEDKKEQTIKMAST